MKESYPDDIMLCFIQGFGNGKIRDYDREEVTDSSKQPRKKHKKLMVHIEQPNGFDPVPEVSGDSPDVFTYSSDVVNRSRKSFAGKSLRLTTGDRFLNRLPEVKRSFSDRFTVIADTSGKRSSKGLETIRKTWSTGNFASGAAGGGCGAPRSAPATPLQLEPHPRKHDKHAVKPLSGSAPSVRADTADDAADGKQPSKSRQKKFQRHFPQVGPEERVLNYYSCALVGDLLLQGHLYITKNYFAFYSNVFGYVTKLLIPITSVLRITKEKVARIIPNAVGVCTRDERHVFGSLLSRDSTYKLMTHVWKASRAPETAAPKPQVSEVELDASEYSPEDESSSGGAEPVPAPVAAPAKRDSDAIMPAGVSAVIQPALLTGAPAPGARRGGAWRAVLLLAVVLLAATAAVLGYRLVAGGGEVSQNEFASLSGDEMYSEVVRWRARLHGRAAAELHAFLTTNLLLLTKVRQSLEALSGVILTDMAHNHGPIVDVPNETAFS